MKNLIKLYPELQKEIQNFEGYFKDLKKFIKITPPIKPTYDKKRDIPILLKHFINVVHIRIITQLSLIRLGLKNQNPETYSIVRATLESVAAMAYVGDRVQREYSASNYDEAWLVLRKAILGSRTRPTGFAKNEEVIEESDKSINVMTYVDKATKLLSKELEKIEGKSHKEGDNYFMSQYEFISEFTHPNYSALEIYSKIEKDEAIYAKPPKILTSENLGIILHNLLPLIPIYLLFLKRAYRFQEQLNKSR